MKPTPDTTGRAGRILAMILAAGSIAPPGVSALWTAGHLSLDGNLRTIAAAIDNYDFAPFFEDEADVLSQTLLRLTLTGRSWERLALEIHGVQSFDVTTAAAEATGSRPFSLVAGETRYRALDAVADWHEMRHQRASLWLDRANAVVRFGALDVTFGRQAITFGKAFFWNPLDVFLPFDPRQFDQEYKPGVDALRLDLALGPFSGLTAVAAAGRTLDASGRARSDRTLDATWFGSAVLGRAFATLEGFDVALQGGKIYGGAHVGGGASGELGPLEARIEVTQLFESGSPPLLPGVFPDSERLVEDAFAAVIGVGRRLESSLTLEAEYFHNGAGDAGDLDASLFRFASGGTLDLGRNLVGAMASYEILPIVTGIFATIVNLDDPSAQIQPRLQWSAGDEIEVLAGGIVNFGERPRRGPTPLRPRVGSEFGTFPDVWYAEVKLFF